jgi:hypothetical protein
MGDTFANLREVSDLQDESSSNKSVIIPKKQSRQSLLTKIVSPSYSGESSKEEVTSSSDEFDEKKEIERI